MTQVLVVGWDGATWAYIDPLVEQGALPHLKALLEAGTRAVLRSTRPPFTNVAWPSLVTGMSPARTGVFDGARITPGTYEFVPTNLTGYRGIPIWQWINRFGRRAGVLNVPMTYPAAPLEGYMVTGFDSPRRSSKVAFPQDLLQQWMAQGHPYRVLEEETNLMDGQNPHRQRTELEEFLRRWEHLTVEQGELVAWLWRTKPVDLMFVVFSVTDSVNHRTRDSAYIRRGYEVADRALGQILEAVTEDTLVCLVSDHGSTPACRYIALYRALHDAGWLHFRPEVALRFWRRLPGPLGQLTPAMWQRLPTRVRQVISQLLVKRDARLTVAFDTVDWDRTQVFARTSLGPLYLNLVGRHPRGCVVPEEASSLKAEVARYFLELQDPEGQPLFARVWHREDLFPDARLQDAAPDLLLEPARWSDHLITGYPSDPLVRSIPPERGYGTHTPDGVLALAGPGIRQGLELSPARIIDVVPTLLAAWQLPISAEVDGRVLQEAFATPREVRRLEVEVGEPAALDAEESEEILARLRALGYVE
jgi:predicted AlkP superfamily phosphohydrolase/phosphomutase